MTNLSIASISEMLDCWITLGFQLISRYAGFVLRGRLKMYIYNNQGPTLKIVKNDDEQNFLKDKKK